MVLELFKLLKVCVIVKTFSSYHKKYFVSYIVLSNRCGSFLVKSHEIEVKRTKVKGIEVKKGLRSKGLRSRGLRSKRD